jgi:hypothetical protein
LPGEGFYNKLSVIPLSSNRYGIALTYCEDGRHASERFVLISATTKPHAILQFEEKDPCRNEIYFHDFDRDGITDVLVFRKNAVWVNGERKLIRKTVAYRGIGKGEKFVELPPGKASEFERLFSAKARARAVRFIQWGGTTVDWGEELPEDIQRTDR